MPNGKSSGLSTGQLTTSGSAQQVLPQNLQRISLVLTNSNASNSVFIGLSSTVTNTTGFEIKPNASQILDSYTGAVFAVQGAGAAVMSWFEY